MIIGIGIDIVDTSRIEEILLKYGKKFESRCFTKIENLGKKMEVRHVWYYENQIMTQVRYNVKKSNVYRSWTKKTISSFQIGNWRVEVQDRNGTIIGTKRFKIKKSS